MKIEKYSSGSSFEEKIGYSRAVKVDKTIYMSGVTGYNYTSMTISEDIVEQTEQCFHNIKTALASFDASLENVVKVSYILPDASLFESCWPILRKHLGTIKPAATMLSAGLANEEMKIEIEVVAVVG